MARRKTLLGNELPQFSDDDNLDEEREKDERRSKNKNFFNLFFEFVLFIILI